MGAVEEFFGIGQADAWDLFADYGENQRATPKFIAKKIEKFVEAQSK